MNQSRGTEDVAKVLNDAFAILHQTNTTTSDTSQNGVELFLQGSVDSMFKIQTRTHKGMANMHVQIQHNTHIKVVR